MRRLSLGLVMCLTGCTAWKVTRLQETIRTSSQCDKVRVSELEEGWRADGCDASWFCPSPSGPCEERTCSNWAEVAYNKCIDHASRGGINLAAAISHAVMADSLIQECRINYDRKLEQCGIAPSSTPPRGSPASM